MAQQRENKLADKMIEDFLNPRFSSLIFAEHIRNLSPAEQTKFMEVFLRVFEFMAQDYILGYFDPRNREAALLAYEFDKVAKALGE